MARVPVAAVSALTVGLRASSATETREQRQQELVQGRHGAVGEDRGPVGVDPGGELVEQHLPDVAGQVAREVAVGDDLVVGDHEIGLDAERLQADPVGQGAEVVAEVQGAGGSHRSRTRKRWGSAATRASSDVSTGWVPDMGRFLSGEAASPGPRASRRVTPAAGEAAGCRSVTVAGRATTTRTARRGTCHRWCHVRTLFGRPGSPGAGGRVLALPPPLWDAVGFSRSRCRRPQLGRHPAAVTYRPSRGARVTGEGEHSTRPASPCAARTRLGHVLYCS